MQKRIISILLSLFMILGTFSPLNLEVKAQDQLNDLKVEDNGEYVTIDITPMVKDAIDGQNKWQYSKYSTMGTALSNQPDTKITVNLVTVGLGGSEFRWDNVGMKPEDIVLTLERITSAGTSIEESYSNIFSNRKRKAEITIKNYVSGDKFFIKANATENITVSAVDRSAQLKQVGQDRPVDLLFIQIPNTKITTKWINAKGEKLEKQLVLPASKGKFDFNFLNDTFSYKFDITNQDQIQHLKKDIRRALARKRLPLEKLNDSDNESIKFNNKTSGTYTKLNENTKDEKVVDFKTNYDPYKGGEITLIVKDKVYNKKPGEEVPDGYYEIAFNSGDGYFTEKDRKAEVIAYTVKDGTTWTDFKELVNITDFPKVNHVNNLKLKNWTNSKGEAFTIADKTSETISESMVFTAQFVELTDDNIQINLSGTGEQNAPRHGDKVVVGKTVKKGSDDVDPKSLSGKTVNIYKTIEAEPKKQLIGSGIVREDGSFTAAIHKDALKAGETIWAEIPTGKDKKISSEKYPTTVKLNPDELNKIIEIASKVLKNYENKKFVNKDKYEALVDAVNGNSSKSIEGGKDLVYIEGEKIPEGKKVGDLKIEEPKDLTDGTVKQGKIDKVYEEIKKAIEELTGNYIPVIKGPDHKEIYVGDTLDLTEGITVTDEDSTKDESDIAQQDGKDFSYKVYTTNSENQKVEVKGDALKNLNSTPGTYEVVYMAKDKSGATATHEMTLVVKEVEVTAIKVTADPTKDQKYLVAKDTEPATPDYTGMQVELTYNNGKKETAKYGKFKPEGGQEQTGFYKAVENKKVAVTELTVEPTQVGIADSPKVITATYEKGSTKLTDNAGKAIIVQVDSDGNGKADESEKFDINYATSFEVVTKPQLKYTVNSSKETATLDLSALLVKVTDTKGNVKYYTWENIKTEDKIKVTLTKKGEGEQAVEVSKTANTELTPKLLNTDEATKATKPFIENHNGAELKVVVDLVKVENGKVVYKTDGKTLERETDTNKTTNSAGTLSVLVDKDKNGTNDLEETTDKPFITSAKNIPTSNEDKTPKTEVTGHAKPGVKIEIKAADASGKPTGKVLGKVDSVGADGTYEVTLNPQQKAGTKVVAVATEGEKKSANSAPKAVIDDMDQDGNDDSKQGFNINKATKIEFFAEPKLDYLVPSKDTELTFDGKDAKDNEISVKISYEENGKTLSNVYKLSELNTEAFKGIVEITPAIGTKDKIGNNPANLVGKNLVVTLKKVVDAENKKQENEKKQTIIDDATATSTKTFAIEIDADGNGEADKNEKTEMPAIISARNVKNATQEDEIETKVRVKALVGSTITIKDENNKVVSDAVKVPVNGSEKYGEVEITLKEKQDAGKKVKAIAKLGEKQPSEPAESIVFEDLDGNGKPDGQGQLDIENIVEFKLASNPDKMKYPLKATDAQETLDLTGLMVYLKDKNGNTGIFEYNKKAESPFEELKNNANFKLQLINSQNEATDIKDSNSEKTKLSTADDLSKVKVSLVKDINKSVETSKLEVFLDANGDGERDTDQTPAPKDLKALNKGTDAFTTITGKAQAGDVIKVYDEDGKEMTTDPATVTVGNDGTFTIKVSKDSKALLENTKLFVTAKANDKEESPRTPVYVKVDKDGNGIADEDEQSAKPTDVKALNQNKVVDGKVTNEPKYTTTVTGKVKPGATVKITSEDGKTDLTPSQVTIDNEGNFTAEIAKQTDGTKIKVWATEPGKQESDPEPATVVRDANNDGIDDSKFSDKPSVKTPVKNGDKTVEVNGKPNAKAYVVITDKDGNETTTPVVDLDGQGKGTINVPELKDGQKVKVVQTEEGKKPVASDEVVVKPNTTDDNLENNIAKAEEKAGNLIDDPNSTADPKDKIRENLDQKSSTDKELQDALEKANEEKEKANKVDQNGKQTPQNTQKDVNDANDRLKKALDEKDKYDKAKKAVDDAKAEWNSIKDKTDPAPTEQEYKNVKDKIDAAQKAIDDLNDKNGTADNTDKPALQKELDKIYLDKVIKQGDEKLKEQGLDPTEKAKLDNAVKQGKDTQGKLNDTDTSNDPDHNKIKEDIKAIEDALNPKGKTDAPTIDSAIIGGTKITGTAPANSVVTVKLGDKVLGKVDADSQGKWSISTEALQENQVVKAQAQEKDKTPSDEVTKTVGLDTSKLKESIDKADPIAGEKDKDTGKYKNLDENNPVDKALKDALDEGKRVKDLGDKNDPTIDQDKVDTAKKNLDKAIAQKEADTAVDNAKDKVLDPNASDDDKNNAIKEAQDKIDKIPGTVNDNPIKKDLQDKLDLIKKIKEGEDRLEKDDVTGKNDTPKKPQKDIDKLKKAIQDGKDALNNKEKDKYGEKTKEVEKAINILNQERINVTFKAVTFGSQTLFLRTSVPGAKIKVSINGKIITKSKVRNKEGKLVDVDYVTTDPFGTYTLFFGNINEDGYDFTKGLSENDEIVVEATKDGYNPGEYTELIY